VYVELALSLFFNEKCSYASSWSVKSYVINALSLSLRVVGGQTVSHSAHSVIVFVVDVAVTISPPNLDAITRR